MKKTLIALLLAAAALPLAAGKPVTVKGSDTMVIMNARLAEAFMRANPGTEIRVTGGGSGVGLAALINGTTDIAASSRPIKTSEVDKLKARSERVEPRPSIAHEPARGRRTARSLRGARVPRNSELCRNGPSSGPRSAHRQGSLRPLLANAVSGARRR